MQRLIVILLLFFISWHTEPSWQAQSSRNLQQLLHTNPDQVAELDLAPLVEFYQKRKFEPLWSDDTGRLDKAYDLLQILLNARAEGLLPGDYYLDEIRQTWPSNTTDGTARLDLLLSAALYRYSNDVYAGRLEDGDLDPDWHIRNKPLDIGKLFADVARKSTITPLLKQLPPQHTGYQALKEQLRSLRAQARQGGWPRFEFGPVLEPGVQHRQVLQLRRRLVQTGDMVVDPFPDMNVYDRWLEGAVKRYQTRHGLEVDGKVGPQTRRSLNVTLGERIQQVRINMERWRWLPRELGKRYVMVNMTGFELSIVENDLETLSMPVIIGKTYRSTPTFSSRLSYMEYNPYWTIPKTIVFEDIIPRQRRNPDYLSSRSIKVYRGWENPREVAPGTIDWGDINPDRFPYWMRQEPGPKNALGRIKFMFGNPYEVYLHGTPDKHLFDRVVRAFSSGCIRVKDPVRLAAFLLNDGSQLMEEDVLANIHLGINQRVVLPNRVPIYIVYWTAWVDQNGNMHYRDDIYGRDTQLRRLFDR